MAVYGEGSTPAALPNAAHIARHDPARVLREVAAGRATLGSLQEHDECLGRGCRLAFLAEVRRRAMVYGDHPDYDEAWRC
jgi:hypothetical protein